MSVPWGEIARGRGYASVGIMLKAMYPKFSLHGLATRFGCSVDAVRRQLEKEGIQLRARGGAQVAPKLDTITVEEYRLKGAKALAQEHGVDVTSIYKHMKKKKVESNLAVKQKARLAEEEAAERKSIEDLNNVTKALVEE